MTSRRNKRELFAQIDALRQKLPEGDLLYTASRAVEVQFHAFDSKKMGAILIGGRVIVINSSRPLTAQRFSLAHELVHFYLHWGKVDPNVDTPLVEWQANEGAAELLMPTKQVQTLLLTHAGLPREQLARQLGKHFGVSPTVATYKLNSMGYAPKKVNIDIAF